MTRLQGAERQHYDSMLTQQRAEFSEALMRERNDAINSLHVRHMMSPIQLQSTECHYHIKRIVGDQSLKLTVLKQLAQDRQREISVEEAEDLRHEVLEKLKEYQADLETGLASNAAFSGRGRGARLRIEQFFCEQRNHLVGELNVVVSRARLGRDRVPSQEGIPSQPAELFVDGIASLSAVRGVPTPSLDELEILRQIPECEIKLALAEIIGEPVVGKDWGGEKSDLFTTRVRVGDQRVSAAFLLKGPAKFGPMHVRDLGKNGDQIDRLFSEPADLMILQHCHNVETPVRNMMRVYAEREGNPKRFCVIDGFDTLRILRAYHKCGQ